MKSLVRNIIIKIIVTVIICTALSLILSMIMPVFNNDAAMDQFENDNAEFIQMQYWNTVQNGFETVQIIVIGICCILVGADVHKIVKIKIKNSKENKNEEKTD